VYSAKIIKINHVSLIPIFAGILQFKIAKQQKFLQRDVLLEFIGFGLICNDTCSGYFTGK